MKSACGLLTLILKTDKMDAIERFCESLKHIMMAVSWGGHESLVIPKCSGLKPEEFDPSNIEHRYIRLYVGLEEPEYIIADLEQALAAI
jgi:cystathionine beta-lyase/cystathionine gamma-synthase